MSNNVKMTKLRVARNSFAYKWSSQMVGIRIEMENAALDFNIARNYNQYNLMSDYSHVTSLQIKRIEKELKQLRENPPEKFRANPVKDNFFEWHFTMQGPEGSDFEFGIYHEYPIKPPNIYFLTPNGRFQLKTKICLNITKYHPENWNPSWTIQTMIEGIIQHFVVKEAFMAVGSLDYTQAQIKKLALDSHKWVCEDCGAIASIMPPFVKLQQEEKKVQEDPVVPPPVVSEEEEEEEEQEEEEEIFVDKQVQEEIKSNPLDRKMKQGNEGIYNQINETQKKFEHIKQKMLKNLLTPDDMRIFNLIINNNNAEIIAKKSIRFVSQKEQQIEQKKEQLISTGIEEIQPFKQVVRQEEESIDQQNQRVQDKLDNSWKMCVLNFTIVLIILMLITITMGESIDGVLRSYLFPDYQ